MPIDLNVGIHDGHSGPVPISHTLLAFNVLAADRDRITPADIDALTSLELVPAQLRGIERYAPYDDQPVLFRRRSRSVRLTIFDGGHEKHAAAALEWLEQQRKPGH